MSSKSPFKSKKSGGGNHNRPYNKSHSYNSNNGNNNTSDGNDTHSNSTEKHEDHYEFGGPLGALLMPFFLPLTVLFLYFAANDEYVLHIYPDLNIDAFFYQKKFQNFIDLNIRIEDYVWAIVILIGWFLTLVVLQEVLPGEIVEGTLLRNGKKLKYKINGHLTFWLVITFLFVGNIKIVDGNIVPGRFNLSYIYDHMLELAVGSCILCTLLSFYLYFKSFERDALLALGGNTESAVYNWFIGRELNPRDGSFDWKEFCELRPGLIGWAIINISCAVKQYELYGALSPSMVLINIFQGLYVWDALYQEKAILSTMDITTDGFGFMLCFGDMAWVPFTYSLQARYLVNHSINNKSMTIYFLVFTLALKIIGFIIFRGSNGEKDRFRRDPTDPSVAHLEVLETKSGSKLLVSGWWGIARKINYTGDWIMSISWCLTTGFDTPVTYFYSIYFAILLIHRALRDDDACEKKYGTDWPAYKSKVPYVFIPGII